MKQEIVIIATDQINKAGICIPASELMSGVETHSKDSVKAGLPPGTPSYIQHDMHRPAGWMEILGHVIDGAMVRLFGVFHQVETDEEKTALNSITSAYWSHFHREGMQVYQEELVQRISPSQLGDGVYLRIEACVISRINLAAELYPNLFSHSSGLVDKDGLTDYRALTKLLKQVQPGVFIDDERGLVLFAHRYFRRSFSHQNKLNGYFLNSFDVASADLDKVKPRLRLDPDLIGHSQTVNFLLEQEYWRGPRFTDDIASLPSGVTELKADNRNRYFEGVDRTQVWWKSAESRTEDDKNIEYRTFEIEELIENSADSLGNDYFGCRYAHAEYSLSLNSITHFDGAIRSYAANNYLDRIDTAIDRAGKRSDYTKLFRFDGPMPVDRWKRLLNDFFRGNPLVPEYLGTSEADEQQPSAPPPDEPAATEPDLCAMIVLEAPQTSDDWNRVQRFMINSWEMTLPNGQIVHAFETGCAAIEQFFRSKIQFNDAISVEFSDGKLNLPQMLFGNSPDFPQYMIDVVTGLAPALRVDIENSRITGVAVAITWQHDGLLTTLSIRGLADLVERVLRRLFEVVDPTEAASVWIEPLSQLIKELAPTGFPTINLTGVLQQRLMYEHSYEEPLTMRVDASIAQALASVGVSGSDIVGEPD